jgi:hypothetical protein
MLIIEAFQLTPVVLLHYSLTHRHNFIISILRLFREVTIYLLLLCTSVVLQLHATYS